MTKKLDPEEKQRRAEERAALSEGLKAGKTAAVVYEELRAKKVAQAREEIDKEDGQAFAQNEKKAQETRRRHQDEMLAREAKEAELAEQRRQKQLAEEAEKLKVQEALVPNASKVPTREGRTQPGYTRCEGSTLNVEENNIPLLDGKTLRDDAPWDYRGKRVLCPKCGNRIGVSPFGKTKEPQPQGYRITTHNRKEKK